MKISSFKSYNQGEDKNSSLLKTAGNFAKDYAGFGVEGKLEKALITVFGVNNKVEKKIHVQFNPSEYTITRTLGVTENIPFGKDVKMTSLKPTNAKFAQFSTTLFFDSITELDSNHAADAIKGTKSLFTGGMTGKGAFNSAKNLYMSDKNSDLGDVCKEFTSLLKYSNDQHKPRMIMFSWGNLCFKGYLTNCTQNFTMFLGNGKPVRAKVTISIKGEEQKILNQIEGKPFESPDRTKQRALVEGDDLWILAYDEYSDPNMWKHIAKENGVLNPRKLSKSSKFKIPAIT